ncbi:MAG TPA: flavodoxin family protein [Clostridiaceae bacterium]|nr:flavodoxin family protein [Clostridiaceae bacterium]
MFKNIVVVNGSPRKGGNTEALADAFVEGAKEAGHTVVKFNVARMKINGCLDCKHCFTHRGECAQKDEMQEIYKELYKADMLVLASPIYWWGFSAQLKAVIDRMFVNESKPLPIKSSALLLVCADTDATTVEPVISQYKKIISYTGWKDVGIIAQKGVSDKGDITGCQSLIDARELGRSI